MMHFSDADSVMQLLIGLNLAYYSFRDIRAPASARLNHNVARSRELVERINAQCILLTDRFAALSRLVNTNRASALLASGVEDRLSVLSMSLRTTEHNVGMHTGDFEHSGERFDQILQRSALLVSLVDFGMLTYSAYHADDAIPQPLFGLLLFFSCIPPALAIWWNSMFASTVRANGESVRRLREKLEDLARDARSINLALVELSEQIQRETAS